MLNEIEICEKLRELSEQIPKNLDVLLPDCKPKEFYSADIEVPFENVKLSKLLRFIADMME